MTEEKKSQIRKKITIIEAALAALLVLYLIYGIVTKRTNTIVFNCLVVFVVVAYLILNDFAEPYLTGVFADMDEFRKEAYKKYMLWDVASMAGLLYFGLNLFQEGNSVIYLALALYVVASKQKNVYRSAYLGDVTKADVEAAKAAVVDADAVSVEDVEESEEITEE